MLCSDDLFAQQYPAVLVSHGVEHHANPYLLLDEGWRRLQPGGFLLLVSARNDAHRTHFRKYDLDDLAALCGDYAGFGNPIVTWPLDYWADLYCAIPKPLEDTPA